MDRPERVKMVRAMEFIARQIYDEEVFWGWLTEGVARCREESSEKPSSG